jgi:Uma2 family endonuclease
MSTVERRPPPATIPPLVAGQRLSQAEFLRRYEATPPGFKAELIGGVVHVPSPVGRKHGISSADMIAWLGYYRARTRGVQVLDNATTAMDELGVPQPDAQLRILPQCGGQTRDEGNIVAGAPELVVEAARSSRPFDLGDKRADYERAGVREYVVVALEPDEVYWYVRRDDKLERMAPGPDGLYRSEVFSGLWLDPTALLNEDLAAVLAALDRGLATPEHDAFVAHLADVAARGNPGL